MSNSNTTSENERGTTMKAATTTKTVMTMYEITDIEDVHHVLLGPQKRFQAWRDDAGRRVFCGQFLAPANTPESRLGDYVHSGYQHGFADAMAHLRALEPRNGHRGLHHDTLNRMDRDGYLQTEWARDRLAELGREHVGQQYLGTNSPTDEQVDEWRRHYDDGARDAVQKWFADLPMDY